MLDLDLWKLALFLILGVAPMSAARAASDAGPAGTGQRRKPGIGLINRPKIQGTFGASEPDIRIVSRVVRSHLNDFMVCYVERQQDAEPAEGAVHVEFTVDRSGQVATSLLRRSTLHVPDIETCVVEAFRKMEFPKPPADKVTIWYGVLFTPPH